MSSLQEQLWVVSYDSPCDRRRRKVARLLEGYGARVQWSVFECLLRAEEMMELERRLRRLIEPDQDSVRLWPLPERSQARILNLGRTIPSPCWEDPIV